MRTRFATLALAGAIMLTACGGDGDAQDAATGFEPVRVGASGFADGAPQPAAAGTLSVTKTIDGAAFFARVEAAGTSGLPEGENARFRLVGVDVPQEDEDGCLAGPSTTHLNGVVRGGQQVRFVPADGADPEDAAGMPVHLWARGLWVNGEVLARGYGEVADETQDRRDNLDAAQAFAQEGEEGVWNPVLCDPEAEGA